MTNKPKHRNKVHLGHFFWPTSWVLIANGLAVILNIALMKTTPLRGATEVVTNAIASHHDLLNTLSGIYSISAFPLVIGLMLWYQWPVIRAIGRLRRGEGSPDSKARQRLLHFPTTAAILSAIEWLFPLLLFTLVIPSFSEGHLVFFFQRAMMLVFVGLLASSVAYYGSSWALRRLIECFFPEGQLAEKSGLKPVSTRFRLYFFYIVAGVLPLITMWLFFYSYEPGNELLLPMGIIAGMALLLGCWAANSLFIRLTRQLKQASEVATAVRNGNLEGWITVTSRDETGRLGDGINKMIAGLLEREQMREVFGHYVSPEVRDHLLAEPPQLGGELREVTVLFADIRDFTVLSGKLTPQRLVGLLNRYFTTAVAVIDNHRGYVNKFIGDAVMAVFGAPLDDPRHTVHALDCAQEMVARIETLNNTGEMEVKFRVGIGLHTGEVIAGNIGAPNRFEYTVIGEPVNVASRIQSLSAILNRTVLISKAVNDVCGKKLEYVGEHELKGLEKLQRLYAI